MTWLEYRWWRCHLSRPFFETSLWFVSLKSTLIHNVRTCVNACISIEVRLIFLPYCPVNLHPLFLFRKHGSVCDFEKRIRSKIWTWKKQGKKQGHFYSKRNKTRMFLLFLNNNNPVFCSLLFPGPDLIFFKFQTRKKISGWPDTLEYWVQID